MQRVLRAYTTAEGAWRLPADVAQIDPKFLGFLLAYEDQRFRTHPGVDVLAAGRATWQAVSHGRIVSGASTLTMQLARLMEPSPRTLGAKLAEMGRALQIEQRLSKDEILGAYLTFAPYGGNLEGVRAASLAYFGKEPRRLTDAEAALLVALPQAPETVRPDRFPHAAKSARDKVLRLMLERGLIDARALETALAETVPEKRQEFPLSAPHLADRLDARSNPTSASSRRRSTATCSAPCWRSRGATSSTSSRARPSRSWRWRTRRARCAAMSAPATSSPTAASGRTTW